MFIIESLNLQKIFVIEYLDTKICKKFINGNEIF